MTRPLIGITGSHDRAPWDIWVDDVVLVPAAYTKAVERAGGQPVVIPPGDCDSSLVEKLDGLVVAGGADLNPGTYGEAPVPETADWRDRQDASGDWSPRCSNGTCRCWESVAGCNCWR